MILRLYRYTLVPGAGAQFEHAVVSEGLPRIARAPDLRFAFATRASNDAGVVVTAWDRFDALIDAVGGCLERPVFLPSGAHPLIASHEVAHFEGLDLPPVGSGDPGVLRLMFGDVVGVGEARYFEWVRTRLWPTLGDIDGLAGSWAGRQTGDRRSIPVIGVTTWRSRHAVVAAGVVARPIDVRGDPGPFQFRRVEVLDLLGAVPEARPDRMRESPA